MTKYKNCFVILRWWTPPSSEICIQAEGERGNIFEAGLEHSLERAAGVLEWAMRRMGF
jgi:hypothetical protein